jgi:Glycosyltransferase family 87
MHRARGSEHASLYLNFFLFFVCPLALVALFTLGTIHHHFAWDFRSYWHAGREITRGNSPYPSTAHGLLTPSWAGDGGAFLYPAPTAWAMTPLGVLPFGLAAMIFMLLSIAVVPVALRLLGVRDWRCYGLVFLWLPTLGAIRLGNITPFLLLGVAACWRLRHETRQAGPLAATVIAKVFLWPLLIWNALAGRLSRTLLSLAFIAAGTLVAWAAIGFAGFSEFPTSCVVRSACRQRTATRSRRGHGRWASPGTLRISASSSLAWLLPSAWQVVREPVTSARS